MGEKVDGVVDSGGEGAGRRSGDDFGETGGVGGWAEGAGFQADFHAVAGDGYAVPGVAVQMFRGDADFGELAPGIAFGGDGAFVETQRAGEIEGGSGPGFLGGLVGFGDLDAAVLEAGTEPLDHRHEAEDLEVDVRADDGREGDVRGDRGSGGGELEEGGAAFGAEAEGGGQFAAGTGMGDHGGGISGDGAVLPPEDARDGAAGKVAEQFGGELSAADDQNGVLLHDGFLLSPHEDGGKTSLQERASGIG